MHQAVVYVNSITLTDKRSAAGRPRVPYLRWVVIGFLAGGGLILLAGSFLIYLGARTPRAGSKEA